VCNAHLGVDLVLGIMTRIQANCYRQTDTFCKPCLEENCFGYREKKYGREKSP
jgi:hypothetical protein